MKYLFDQNISHRILQQLPARYGTSSTVKLAGLENASDFQVWNYARENGFIIITKDVDFNDLSMLHGFPPKIVWIRAGNLRTAGILEILLAQEELIREFILDPEYACLEIS